MFAITIGATYRFEFELTGSLGFMDVYTAQGDWLPGLAVNAAEVGSFTSADYLAPGNYYIEVRAIGN